MNFDPFSDRTARDIRNSLSSAFVSELSGEQQNSLSKCVGDWLAILSGEPYLGYIQTTYAQYKKVIPEIVAARISNPRHQAVILWNNHLFFEMHELLETIWKNAKEPEKTALKGWIQAAGAFVHARRGKLDAARGLAAKAGKYLSQSRAVFGYILNIDQLIEAMAGPLTTPPRLILSDD